MYSNEPSLLYPLSGKSHRKLIGMRLIGPCKTALKAVTIGNSSVIINDSMISRSTPENCGAGGALVRDIRAVVTL